MAGAWPTTIVRLWVAFGAMLLAAVMSRVIVPVAVGVPDSRAVPLPLSTKVSPAGRAPVSVIAGVGEPVVVTAKAPAVPRVKSAAAALVMVGRHWWRTVMVRARVAVDPEVLVAEMVTG